VTYVGSKLIHLSHWIPAFAGMTMFVMLLLQILYLWHCHFIPDSCEGRYPVSICLSKSLDYKVNGTTMRLYINKSV